MHFMKRAFVAMLLAVASVLAWSQDGPEVGAHLPSQSAADVLRVFAGADCAFMAAGLVKNSFDKDNLASLLQFPSDEVVVVNLTGSEIKQALERSVSLYPQPNPSFLQLSGLEATFNRAGTPGQRIVNVAVNGSKLDEKRTYSVAMPASLGRGGLGYFKIWDTSKIARSFDKTTVEKVLKGKHYSDTSQRWSGVG
jgi:2',3'-cyclic-nucleotide 2'-phosphodiesterase (5'-nucleotidase family)